MPEPHLSWRAERVYDPLTSRCPFIDRSEELRSSPSRHLSLQIYVFSVKQPRVNHFFAQKRHISPLFWLISLRKWLVALVFLGLLVLLGGSRFSSSSRSSSFSRASSPIAPARATLVVASRKGPRPRAERICDPEHKRVRDALTSNL